MSSLSCYLRRLHSWILTLQVANIHAQRQALSTSTPRYLMDLPTLKNMAADYNRVMETLNTIMNALMRGGMLNPQFQQALAHRQKLQQQMQLAQAQQQHQAQQLPVRI